MKTLAVSARKRLGRVAPAVTLGVTIAGLIVGGLTAVASGSSKSEAEGLCSARVLPAPTGSLRKKRGLLVPRARIRAMLACRYNGEDVFNPPKVEPGLLAHETIVSSTPASAIAHALNRLKPVEANYHFGCDADQGGRIYLIFRFVSGESVVVIANLSGCRLAEGSPGIGHQFFLSPKLQDRLEELTRR